MHQQPRVPPRVASPANSPRVEQHRSNSSRDNVPGASRPRAGSNVSGRDTVANPTAECVPQTQMPPADSVKKLDQIVQNFFNKVATLVIDSRIKVKHSRGANGHRKTSKWFQIETDEFDDFKDDLKIWKTAGSLENLPPPLIVEIYLDTSSLKESQSLTIVDEDGKRWDVMERLNAADISTGSNGRVSEVILERWRIELKPSGTFPTEDFGPVLPTVYKKAIVFFRSLFTTTRLLPAWKFASQSAVRNSVPALVTRCRIRTTETSRKGADLLRYPIVGRSEPVTDYVFGDLETPVGRLRTSVTYRNDCTFRTDDSEALLSSRFMGVDDDFFKPSLRHRTDVDGRQNTKVGSLRDHKADVNPPGIRQTYGSLSTFHGDGPLGTSPISALKAVRVPGSDTSSPPASFPQHHEIEPPSSLPVSRRPSTSRPNRMGDDGTGRRPSISFQPFKAGSLSGSPIPRNVEPESYSSQHSTGRPSGPPSLSQPRNRTSLTAGMPASLRGGPPPGQPAESLPTSSPRPVSTSRYSSSFTHRRGRLSVGGASKAGDDEQGSSGRQSLASSVAQPGSGLLAEPGTSSGSLQAEEDNISEFLKALDSKRTLKSFESTKRGESATNRTVAQLSKFHLMKDSNNALTESMTSSMQMHRSSSSSSRQLTSVPGVSMSASSSPSKPQSPHTPHTPAIPSRLSENSTAETGNSQGRASSSRHRRPSQTVVPEASRESTIRPEGTTAIDIPLSPRIGFYQRRSSSAAQGSRAVIEDDADLPFAANRSISLGADDREPPTRSGLLGRQLEAEASGDQAAASGIDQSAGMQSTENESETAIERDSAEYNPSDGFLSGIPSSSPFGRRRYTGMSMQRRHTPPQSSRGSFNGSTSRLGRDDNESIGDEPLVFDLSEMDPQGRRSIEDGRGGAAIGSDRGGIESRGASRRGW